MAKILVTGASGFIGRHLCAALIRDGHQVWGVGRGRPWGMELAGRWVVADLAAPALETSGWPRDIEVVLHLAQSRRYREIPTGMEDVFAVNVRSTFVLLEYAHRTGIPRFLHASSGSIYGYGASAHVETEIAAVPEAADFYRLSKYLAEAMAAHYRRYFNVVILRPFFVYGPGQAETALIPRLVRNVADGHPIILDGPEGLVLNPIYIDDAVTVIRRLLDRGEPITVNVAGAETLSLRRIGELIGQMVQRTPVFKVQPADDHHALMGDISRLRSQVGYEPRVSFCEGLQRMLPQVLTRSSSRC